MESLDTITDLLPESEISCSTIPSECNSADMGTKVGDSPAKLASSRLWRFGHSSFEDVDLLSKTQFLRARGKERTYAQLNPSDLSSEEKRKLTIYSRMSEKKTDDINEMSVLEKLIIRNGPKSTYPLVTAIDMIFAGIDTTGTYVCATWIKFILKASFIVFRPLFLPLSPQLSH